MSILSHQPFEPNYFTGETLTQPRFLACLRCRTKKARCDNVSTACHACVKANAECVRPTERKRKRTRREMEDAEQERSSKGLGPIRKRSKSNESTQPTKTSSEMVSLTSVTGPLSLTHPLQFLTPPYMKPSPLPQLHSVSSSDACNMSESPTHLNSITPPKDPEEVVEALSRRIAYLEGDPGESRTLKVHYYRFSGCTAIHPGFNKIVIKLRSSNVSAASSPTDSVIDPTLCLPDPTLEEQDISHLPPDEFLVDTFFTHFGQHFPFIRQDKVKERIAAGTMSAFLLHAMNSLAVRFSQNQKRKPSQYIHNAWSLALPLLRLPSRDVVGGLMLLCWAEFGENSESGLWNFAGLAIRMALDLGLHKSEEESPDDDGVCCGKLLFWSLFVMDRILALGTGRPVTIQEDTIEVSLPTDGDFSPQILSPFVRIVSMFVFAGRIADVMNGSRGCPRTLVCSSMPSPEILSQLQNQLVEFLGTLPPQICWSVENFRTYSSHCQAGSFLFLHLWANALLALIHHPNLGRSLDGLDTPLSSGMKRSIKLSLASSRQIADCLVFADLFDAASYCATPFINQCLFIAGVAFIHDAQTDELQVGSIPSEFLYGLVKQNLSVVLKALKRMEGYWSGLGYVIDVLEQRASGRGWARVDFSLSGDKSNNFISLPDMGILKRIVRNRSASSASPPGAELFHNTPANNWSFETLLHNYQVEEITTSATTDFDFSGVFPQGFS